MTTVVERALAFATQAHGAQFRKYTGEPYVQHCEAVAKIVQSVPHTESMVCAAYLHDVVEDTPVRLPEITREFGVDVSGLVSWLTDVSRPEHGNRAARKQIDRDHLAAAPAAAQTIKVADLIDNTSSIVAHDPGFARIYMREKRLLLDVLTRADRILVDRAERALRAYEQSLLDDALR